MHKAKEHVNLTIWIRVWQKEPAVYRDNSMDDDDDDDDDDDSGAVLEQLLFFLAIFWIDHLFLCGYVLMFIVKAQRVLTEPIGSLWLVCTTY